MSRFGNLTRMLGEKILREKGQGFDEVTYVDLTKERTGYCHTCADTEYLVVVHFRLGDKSYKREKYYSYMGLIIKELEAMDDEVDWDDD